MTESLPDRLKSVPLSSVPRLAGLACLLVVSGIFGLPHIIIPLRIAHLGPYTPFAVNGVSALTYDESYLYAAQTNYTSRHWQPSYDTDVYEYRHIPTPFPYVPYFLLGSLAHLSGGVNNAFILCDFLLPPLACFIVYALLRACLSNDGMAALGSLTTILVGFGPRTFFQVLPDLVRTGWSSVIQPLEYSRLLHPQFSFTLFLLALYLLWRALEHSSLRFLVATGVLGGSLFYVYAYYWPVWLGATCLLAFVGCGWGISALRRLLISVGVSLVISAGFWYNVIESRRAPNYLWRTARFGMEFGHLPRPGKLLFTAICLGLFTLFVLFFWALQYRRSSGQLRRHDHNVLLLLGAIFVGACAALNMEVITGTNVESMEHYPNRVFQPCLIMFAFVLVGSPLLLLGREHRGVMRAWRLGCLGCIAVILSLATIRQTIVAINTAPLQIYKREHQLLYTWLNANTAIDTVVLLPVSEVAYLLPVYTRNCQWIPNGTRTTASNEEILERFLAGAKLLGKRDAWVRAVLSQASAEGTAPLGLTYVYYLFQGNYDSPDRRLRNGAIDLAVDRYRKMDLGNELSTFRLDYVYSNTSDELQSVPGYRFREVYRNEFGVVYALDGHPNGNRSAGSG